MGPRPGFALPTHRLTVRFTNRGTESVSFRVEDVQSLLGTVAVHPDRLALEPGQSAEIDPILASPGAFFEQLEVGIVVKRNDAAAVARLNLHPPSD